MTVISGPVSLVLPYFLAQSCSSRKAQKKRKARKNRALVRLNIRLSAKGRNGIVLGDNLPGIVSQRFCLGQKFKSLYDRWI